MKILTDDRHTIATFVGEHHRENAMQINLEEKYDLGRRLFVAQYGHEDYTDAVQVMLSIGLFWLPTCERGWNQVRSGYDRFISLGHVCLDHNITEPRNSEHSLGIIKLNHEAVEHFHKETKVYFAHYPVFYEYYTEMSHRIRNVRTSEQLEKKCPEYKDLLARYMVGGTG